jgi:hypothetical protein
VVLWKGAGLRAGTDGDSMNANDGQLHQQGSFSEKSIELEVNQTLSDESYILHPGAFLICSLSGYPLNGCVHCLGRFYARSTDVFTA